MDASKLPKGQSKEDSVLKNKPGIYKHKDTGAIFETSQGEAGSIQADALLTPSWKDAWEWIGEPKSHQEILASQRAQAEKDAKSEANSKVRKQLEEFAANKQ